MIFDIGGGRPIISALLAVDNLISQLVDITLHLSYWQDNPTEDSVNFVSIWVDLASRLMEVDSAAAIFQLSLYNLQQPPKKPIQCMDF